MNSNELFDKLKQESCPEKRQEWVRIALENGLDKCEVEKMLDHLEFCGDGLCTSPSEKRLKKPSGWSLASFLNAVFCRSN
jgi:hypothetical protein